ncbi:AAA family ATPase [Aquabacterium sp. A3]|uniref:ATP-binding protein n=1 Tax=Aquabacterium sp. A3 TaxID=3132829 RepID=UPI003119C8E2
MEYRRPLLKVITDRLNEVPRRLQILAGPRQVGKTTLVHQFRADRPAESVMLVAADGPHITSLNTVDDWDSAVTRRPAASFDAEWLIDQWSSAEKAARAWHLSALGQTSGLPFVLVIDEVQKIPRWSDHIKGLWDRQVATAHPMQVMLLGSSPLLMQKGLSESLAGRYEVIPITHWSFEEMNSAFNFSLDQYIFFGAYPGSASYIHDESRWRDYVVHSLIEPNIERDILMMTRVDKPALLKQLFEVGCSFSGQIVSLDKTLGHLNDAGNVTTLARYLELLGHAGLMSGLHKHAAQVLRKRQSPPKFQVLNNALMSAKGQHRFAEALADKSHWGRLVESTVGAHLVNSADKDTRVHYWREGGLEVDFVIEHRGRLAALEVKSGRFGASARHAGLDEFTQRFPACKKWVVGSDALPLGEFLRHPAAHWVA